jgi:hypothetical protein
MTRLGSILVSIALAVPVTAGELSLTTGARLDAELTGGPVLVSIGTDVVEVNPEAIGLVIPGEIRLKDGRVLAGTLVGGRLRTRTAVGELAVPVEALQSFRAEGFVEAASGASPAPETVAPQPGAEPVASVTPASTAQPARTAQPVVTSVRVSTTSGPTAVLARPVPGPLMEVVADQSLFRDALTNASEIGRVIRGQTVTKIDAIDRRLTIFNRVIFDGGYWIKVRVGDGTEGWVPATSVREVR